MIMRVDNWLVEYHNTINVIRLNPFQWGNGDCLYGLAVPVLKAMTGNDYFAKYADKYKTAKGAIKIMRKAGFETLADLVASELQEIHPSRCTIGDIVAIPTDDEFGFSIGVANGERVFVMQETGLATRDLLESKRAFRIA